MIDSSSSILFSWSHSQKKNLRLCCFHHILWTLGAFQKLPAEEVCLKAESCWGAWQNPLRKWWLQKEQAHLSHLGPGPWQLVIYLMYASCSAYVAGVLPNKFLSLGRGWFKVRIYKSVLGIHCYMMWFIPVKAVWCVVRYFCCKKYL